MKQFIAIKPQSGTNHQEQFENCLMQVNELLNTEKYRVFSLIKVTVFIFSDNIRHFLSLKEQFSAKFLLSDRFLNLPQSFIPQAPCDSLINFEIILIETENLVNLEFKRFIDFAYAIVKYDDREELISSSITFNEAELSLEIQFESAFNAMKSLLGSEGFSLSDIVRQWAYIGKLLDCSSFHSTEMQNYQIFNEVRTSFYDSVKWNNSYPAATGIGMDSGALILEFIACKANDTSIIKPLGNPRQKDAHKYSDNVLIGSDEFNVIMKNTPKFERAKLISSGKNAEIYISGTAAILGENSVMSTDAGTQTKITIENIQELLSAENLNRYGLSLEKYNLNFMCFRVYIKNQNDYSAIKTVFEDYFPEVPAIYIIADVCRAELLVEIEAYASIS